MEAEELEELNPSIKGKRLQVVDEVFAPAYAVRPPDCSCCFASRLLFSNLRVVYTVESTGIHALLRPALELLKETTCAVDV